MDNYPFHARTSKRSVVWKSSDLDWRMGFSMLAVLGFFLTIYLRVTQSGKWELRNSMPDWIWFLIIGITFVAISLLLMRLSKVTCAIIATISLIIAFYHAFYF